MDYNELDHFSEYEEELQRELSWLQAITKEEREIVKEVEELTNDNVDK